VVSVSNFPASQSTTFGAVTGSVSVLNFPSTQTIAGAVTANIPNTADFFKPIGTGGIADTLETYDDPTNQMVVAVHVKDTSGNVLGSSGSPLPISGTVTANLVGWDGGNQENFRIGGYSVGGGDSARLALEVIGVDGNPLPVSGTVTVGNSVTIGSLPAISGTVTANLPQAESWAGIYDSGNDCIKIELANLNGDTLSPSNPLPISGTVTIGSLPAISGTVTAAAPNGTLTTRFGTPVTANTAFATSAVTNTSRKYLLIQNVTTGSNVITVGIGFTPTTTQGIQLTAGAGITFESSYIPTGAVQILSSVTASNFTILEA
jgi:hypothetical protein